MFPGASYFIRSPNDWSRGLGCANDCTCWRRCLPLVWAQCWWESQLASSGVLSASPRTFNPVIQGFVFLHKPPGWEVDGGMDAGRLVLISSISSIFKSCSIQYIPKFVAGEIETLKLICSPASPFSLFEHQCQCWSGKAFLSSMCWMVLWNCPRTCNNTSPEGWDVAKKLWPRNMSDPGLLPPRLLEPFLPETSTLELVTHTQSDISVESMMKYSRSFLRSCGCTLLFACFGYSSDIQCRSVGHFMGKVL